MCLLDDQILRSVADQRGTVDRRRPVDAPERVERPARLQSRQIEEDAEEGCEGGQEMDFEQLHLRTVELLAAKVQDYGLQSIDDENLEQDETSVSGDSLLAGALAAALRESRSKEISFVEQQEAPEVATLRANMQRLRLLKDKMGVCKTNMDELRTAYEGVTARTSSLHEACDRALAYQTALSAGAEQIKTNLHFFKQADIIMKKLNNTAKLSVTGQTFTGILATIDDCLKFLKQHPEYKESALFYTKFEQCLSRAMTWIRSGVSADLEASVADVRDRQAQLQADYAKLGRLGADDDTFALLYGVFASRANSVKSALSVAESRFANVPEFQEMLSECQQAYFQIRQQLLWPIIQATLAHLADSRTHLDSSCALTRNGCSFILRVCDDEFRLYRQFFSTDSGEPLSPRGIQSPTPSYISVLPHSVVHPFEEFTEGLCRLLYDMLRPIVIHNPHLETLAELCTILKVEMIEERCALMASIVGDEASLFDPRAGFVGVMGELVGDVAERIVYRASTYGNTDIAGYKPAPGDLAYPEKLEMMKSIELSRTETSPSAANGEEASDQIDDASRKASTETKSAAPISAVDLHCLWYPTVRRTVMCLAKLFKCLDLGVFQSLARDLLSMCCESLDEAAVQIAARQGAKGPLWKKLDSELFVVKHLLILREQTTPYRQAASQRADATLPTREMSIDFARMKNSFLEDKSRWFELSSNNAFLEILFSLPVQVSEQSGDSRQIIDSRLRTACNHLISSSAGVVLGDMVPFVDAAEDESLKPGFQLKNHTNLAPKALHDVASAAFKSLANAWPDLRLKYSLYIGVPETESILLSPVRKRIAETFARATAFANRAYDEEAKQIAALPSVQQVYLLLHKD